MFSAAGGLYFSAFFRKALKKNPENPVKKLNDRYR